MVEKTRQRCQLCERRVIVEKLEEGRLGMGSGLRCRDRFVCRNHSINKVYGLNIVLNYYIK